jgi:hypothetical protein
MTPAIIPMAMALAAAAGAGGAAPAPSPADLSPRARFVECAAATLRPHVGPEGIKRAWPEVAALPASLDGGGRAVVGGTLISDEGLVADGFRHTLHVDHAAGAAYIVEDGGFAGQRRVYGPLPLPGCEPPASAAR